MGLASTFFILNQEVGFIAKIMGLFFLDGILLCSILSILQETFCRIRAIGLITISKYQGYPPTHKYTTTIIFRSGNARTMAFQS